MSIMKAGKDKATGREIRESRIENRPALITAADISLIEEVLTGRFPVDSETYRNLRNLLDSIGRA